VSVAWQSTGRARGLLLVSAEPGPVTTWVRRGQVACELVALLEWTALLPAEPHSRAQPPYDDPVSLLASRPLPRRLRPALGFFVVGERAVVTVQGRGWRPGQQWLAWERGAGARPLEGLDLARPSDLVAAAGHGLPGSVLEVLRATGGDPDRTIADLMSVLRLPGSDLMLETARPRGQVVAPTAQAVSRFDARMHEQARHRAELEEDGR
jgi:hypothetical protein